MADFEQIVRPFQTPNVFNPPLSVETIETQFPSGIPILTWGAPGTPPTAYGLNFKVKNADKQWKEASRKVTPVRIQNPDDSSQYVIAQRIDSIQFTQDASGTPTSGDSGSAGGVASNTAYSSDTQNTTYDGSNPSVTPTSQTDQNVQSNQPENDTYTLNTTASPNETPDGPSTTVGP